MAQPMAAPIQWALSDPGERQAVMDPRAGQLLKLLYRQVRSLSGPRPDLDDLVQLAAERALRSLPRFDGRSALSTWTYGIAYRTIVDQGRFWSRWRRRFEHWDEERDPEPRSGADTEAAVLELRRARRVHEALRRLPPAKRAVLVMHDLEGMPLHEVAEAVGANDRTVRSRLRDGRRRLAELLRADPLFDPQEEEP
jgi:RNA polymerase sigma-70 factor (ECF subfamily)